MTQVSLKLATWNQITVINKNDQGIFHKLFLSEVMLEFSPLVCLVLSQTAWGRLFQLPAVTGFTVASSNVRKATEIGGVCILIRNIIKFKPRDVPTFWKRDWPLCDYGRAWSFTLFVSLWWYIDLFIMTKTLRHFLSHYILVSRPW